MTLAWHEEPISKAHNRDAFDCGDDALNTYLRRHACQNHVNGVSKTILAVSDENGGILGFYSLSPASVAYARVPEVLRRGLARYDVPGFRLGRLAVALAMQGRGLGGQLLLSAARRCLLAAEQIGGVLLLIDAKNERAATWYETYGAQRLADAALTLALPLETARAALKDAGKL